MGYKKQWYERRHNNSEKICKCYFIFIVTKISESYKFYFRSPKIQPSEEQSFITSYIFCTFLKCFALKI